MKESLERWNIGVGPRAAMSPSIREQLLADLAPDVTRLAGLLDRDLSHWLR